MPFVLLIVFMFILGLAGKRAGPRSYVTIAVAAAAASYLALR